MIANNFETRYQWSSLQEPRTTIGNPSSCMRLLSAIDMGWQIVNSTLMPSWDQTGFIYKVIIQKPFGLQTEEIILPRTAFVDEILERNGIVC